MKITFRSISAAELPEYSQISIAFETSTWLRPVPLAAPGEPPGAGMGGIALVEEPADPPLVKEFDVTGGRDTGPNTWPQEFDIQNWEIFLALDETGAPVGGAAVAMNTAGVNMLEGRADLAVLWDIRVAPQARGLGVGRALFEHALEIARQRGCRQMKIETQNINPAACRFYARMGAHLGAIHRYAYAGEPEVAHETMLLWYINLE
jgi:ribosomal protein S18 acetylase RimI-like enzyme